MGQQTAARRMPRPDPGLSRRYEQDRFTDALATISEKQACLLFGRPAPSVSGIEAPGCGEGETLMMTGFASTVRGSVPV